MSRYPVLTIWNDVPLCRQNIPSLHFGLELTTEKEFQCFSKNNRKKSNLFDRLNILCTKLFTLHSMKGIFVLAEIKNTFQLCSRVLWSSASICASAFLVTGPKATILNGKSSISSDRYSIQSLTPQVLFKKSCLLFSDCLKALTNKNKSTFVFKCYQFITFYKALRWHGSDRVGSQSLNGLPPGVTIPFGDHQSQCDRAPCTTDRPSVRCKWVSLEPKTSQAYQFRYDPRRVGTARDICLMFLIPQKEYFKCKGNYAFISFKLNLFT